MKSDDDIPEQWNKAQRLAVAAAVAPSLRENSAEARQRRVARLDKDGNVVGYTTWDEVQWSLLRRQEIELQVVEGVRPKAVICTRCGSTVKVKKAGHIPKLCPKCVDASCADCGVPLPRAGYLPTAKKRNTRCRDCYQNRGGVTRLPCVDCGTLLSAAASSPNHPGRVKGIDPRCVPCTKAFRARNLRSCDLCQAKLPAKSKRGRCKACSYANPKPRLRCVECNSELSAGASAPSAIAKRGDTPPKCGPCARKPKHETIQCSTCSATLGSHMMRPSVVAARKGAPPRCRSCSARDAIRIARARQTKATLQANAKRAWETKRKRAAQMPSPEGEKR